MTKIEDREKAFEQKFAKDQELAFKVESRASRLIGMWVAEKLGLSGEDAKTYAREVVAANLDEPGLDDVIRKVKADLDAKSAGVSAHAIEKQTNLLLEEAKRQLMEEEI